MTTTRERWEAELVQVPRGLIEDAIDALHEQAANAEHWRGIRDSRIDNPTKAAERLQAIIGDPPEPTPEERAASTAAGDAALARMIAEIQQRHSGATD